MVAAVIDADTSSRLARLARQASVGPETVVLAAVALLLRRYTATPVRSLRWRDATVPIDLSGDGPVSWLLALVNEALVNNVVVSDGVVNDAVPADNAVPPALGGVDGDPFGPEVACAADLTGPGWELVVACPDELAEAFGADLHDLLAELAGGVDVSTVDILPVAQYERRRTAVAPPAIDGSDPTGYRSIPDAFAAQVAANPDRPAVLGDERSLTYHELGSAAAATAAAIAVSPAGAGPAALVCRHGVNTVVAMLAALAGGRAYVPLDPAFPPRRLAEILADCAAAVLITDDEHRELANRLAVIAGVAELPTVRVAAPAATADLTATLAGLRSRAEPEDPAYLLYTSGSTGVPKGVVQSHRNVLASVATHIRDFAIRPEDRTSVLTSFGFDMAVTDTYAALLSGAAAVPVDIRTFGLGHLVRALAERAVSIYHSTPTVFRYLTASLGPDGRLPAIRSVLLGGEEVTRHDVELTRRHFAPDAVFVNGYGATEISFIAQYHLPATADLDLAVVPVGYPLDGIEVVLVDRAQRPTCLTGEVLVRSPRVALGYWRRDELTAGRFGSWRGERCYRTGDVATRLADGRLVFRGRADRMVKIRGFRVELGEVEAHLSAVAGVGQAAAIARPTSAGEQEIVGYVVAARGGSLDPSAVRAALVAELPEFMLPRTVVVLDGLPMGPTGKLDTRALPAPPSTVEALAAPPASALEEMIGAAWCAALGIPRVDRHVSFIDMGGHSLQVALVQQRLEAELGRHLPVARFFEFPTVAGLAAYLSASEPAADAQSLRAAERMRRRREARR